MSGPAPRLQGNWDWRAAGNFIGGGAGSGLLMAAAILATAGAPFAPFLLLGLVLVATGLCLVWLEIGRPWRFLHVFFNARTSWMTREALVALPVFAIGMMAVVLNSVVLAVLAAVLALAFVYCQAKILRAAKGIPAWREPMVMPVVIATAITEGVGLMLIGLPLLVPVPAALFIVFMALLAIRFSLWEAYRARLAAGRAPHQTLRALAGYARWFAIAGFAVPAVLALVALTIAPIASIMGVAGGICAVATGAWLKLVLVTRAAHTQGFAIARAPVRGAGEGGSGAAPGWR